MLILLTSPGGPCYTRLSKSLVRGAGKKDASGHGVAHGARRGAAVVSWRARASIMCMLSVPTPRGAAREAVRVASLSAAPPSAGPEWFEPWCEPVEGVGRASPGGAQTRGEAVGRRGRRQASRLRRGRPSQGWPVASARAPGHSGAGGRTALAQSEPRPEGSLGPREEEQRWRRFTSENAELNPGKLSYATSA